MPCDLPLSLFNLTVSTSRPIININVKPGRVISIDNLFYLKFHKAKLFNL